MDKINKALFKLPDAERKKLMSSFDKVVSGQTQGLKIKKLKGHKDLYRLRVGNNRLIYKPDLRIIPHPQTEFFRLQTVFLLSTYQKVHLFQIKRFSLEIIHPGNEGLCVSPVKLSQAKSRLLYL